MEYNVEKISSKIAIENFIKKIIKKILFVILIITSAINIVLLYYNFQGEENPKIMNMYFFNIISESMTPNINVNDIIIVKNVDTNSLKIGDVITFLENKKIISHRIINVLNSNEKLTFKTKGDNNQIEDSFSVEENQVYGKVIYTIPKIGGFVRFIQNKKGLVVAVLAVQVFFICFTLKENRKNRRKMLRKKYEIKKKRESYKNFRSV